MVNEISINAETPDGQVTLRIIGEEQGRQTIFEVDPWEAFENGEAPVQLLEGCFYEYNVAGPFYLAASQVVAPSRMSPAMGRLTPYVYVGTLAVEVMCRSSHGKCGEIKLEIRSRKTNYRTDYRLMLEGITRRCTDLLFRFNAPVTHYFTPDHTLDPRTLYQRFAFVNSMLGSDEFEASFQKIVSNPVVRWSEEAVSRDARSIRRIDRKISTQMARGGNRTPLPVGHVLAGRISTLPARITSFCKRDSSDTAENRFVKYALEFFSGFAADIAAIAPAESRLRREAATLAMRLDQMLSNPLFKDISRPARLSFTSQALLQRQGYKQMLRTWLMFDFAANLVWRGGDDVYDAGKKDVAALYEYWLFFELLDLVKTVFAVEPASVGQLIAPTADGLGLRLKIGCHLAVSGVFGDGGARKLNVEFSFNRSFSGRNDYPEAGSWTTGMRPDFTLSIWPAGVSQAQAETEELIVHIHFDAKYKAESVAGVFGETEMEHGDEALGYDHDDLLKMHSYKDAIRRTAGAYVLYPGEPGKAFKRKGFHELIPGLGAFAIRPSQTDTGREELKRFLQDVVWHFQNRASQREQAAFRSFDIYNHRPGDEVRELLPEAFGKNRDLLPDNTFVLVGYYKSEAHLKWIRKYGLYNFRTGSGSGSLSLGLREVNARYLLLHGPGETVTGILLSVLDPAPRLFSRRDLLKKHYPGPSRDLYIVYETGPDVEAEFLTMRWNVARLPGYRANRASGLPFSVSLTELMKVLVK